MTKNTTCPKKKTAQLLSSIGDDINGLGGINLKDQATTFDGLTDMAHTLMARDYKGFGNQSMTGVIEPFCAASRGRNPKNTLDRTTDFHTEQKLEVNKEGICNCLTSVQKDCYVCEPQVKKKPRIYPGARFGRLVAKRDTGEKQGTNHIWECNCDCGKTCYVNTGRLGITTNSCGCLQLESHKTHNMSNTRLYNIWCLMKTRCFNEKSKSYINYGARGITICEEWLQFENFYQWAINNGYREDLTIERKNNDGNYEPSNCIWADLTTQMNNRRNWGEVEYYGIVKDNTGYRAQVTVNGKKVYIAHSINDIEYLVNERNKYIDQHNLPNKKNVFKKPEDAKLGSIIYDDDYNSWIHQNKDAITTLTTNCEASEIRTDESETIAMCLNSKPVENVGGNSCLSAVQEDDVIWRIRKLTPKECFRLMGFTDEDFYRAEQWSSDTALYKQAGNSIVTSCLVAIFSALLLKDGYKADVWTQFAIHFNNTK